MFNELSFLTRIPELYNDDNANTIWNDLKTRTKMVDNKPVESPKKCVVFKNGKPCSSSGIKNYYKNTIYNNKSDLNPYLKLLKDFESNSYQSMKFQAADFAYLLNLGVYPINRMWVLRRFDDFSSPPNNLQIWRNGGTRYNKTKPRPFTTLVGWVEPDQENFFNINFNETWVTMTERLDQVVMKILESEFGLKASSVLSVPGWSQGLLFGFMKKMGITEFGENNIPQGKPEVLQEAAARANNSDPGYGNVSTMSLTLKTVYEQKFIGDIDPGNAMLDIIYRCLKMGTRDTLTIMKGDSPVIQQLRTAAAAGNSAEAWWTFIQSVISAFTGAITEIFDSVKGIFKNIEVGKEGDKKSELKPGEIAETDIKGDALNPLTNTLSKFTGDVISGTLKTVLTSTVAKWKYALMGSIAVMTGENSTPWHLTLGNPYSPFISLGNIIVKDVKLDFNNEFGFNDIPTRLNVEVRVELGRNLGAQEIFQMFNNGYQRIYTPSTATKNDTNAGKTDTKNESKTPPVQQVPGIRTGNTRSTPEA